MGESDVVAQARAAYARSSDPALVLAAVVHAAGGRALIHDSDLVEVDRSTLQIEHTGRFAGDDAIVISTQSRDSRPSAEPVWDGSWVSARDACRKAHLDGLLEAEAPGGWRDRGPGYDHEHWKPFRREDGSKGLAADVRSATPGIPRQLRCGAERSEAHTYGPECVLSAQPATGERAIRVPAAAPYFDAAETSEDAAEASESATPAIPRQLRIGHARYTVTVSNDEIHKADSENHTNYAGFSNGSSLKIVLREDNPHDYQAETLLHEVIHQCLRVTGVDPDTDGKAGLADVEERAVKAMTGPLLRVLREHPDLVAYLLHVEA